MAAPSGDILDNTKLLSTFAQQVMALQDTPALIQWVAADADRMVLCHAVVCADQRQAPVFYQRLNGICQSQGLSVERLQQRLVPVSRSLGLLQPERETDHYLTLGVAADADEEHIRAAFRSKARLLHPDMRPDGKAESHLFIALNIAYQTLIDPERRRQYDLNRERSRSWHEACDEPAVQRPMAPSRLKPVWQLGAVVLALFASVFLINVYDHNRVLSEGPAASKQGAPVTAKAPEDQHAANRNHSIAASSLQEGSQARDTKPTHVPNTMAARENANSVDEMAKPSIPPVLPTEAPRDAPAGAASVEKEARQDDARFAIALVSIKKRNETSAGMERTVVAEAAPDLLAPSFRGKPSHGSGESVLTSSEPRGSGSPGSGVDTTVEGGKVGTPAFREPSVAEGAKRAAPERVIQTLGAGGSIRFFITVGDWVEVKVDGLSLRETPRVGSEKRQTLPIGFRARVLEGPVRADDIIWWQVEAAEGERGWVAEKKAFTSGNADRLIQMLEVVAGPPLVPPRQPEHASTPPASPERIAPPPLSPPVLLPGAEQIQAFLDRFCSLYAGKDLIRFADQFKPDATENGTPFSDLLSVYRQSFSNMEAIGYRITLQRHAVRPGNGTVALKGRYRLDWRNMATGADMHDEGAIEMELGFQGGNDFKVNSMQYRSTLGT